VTPGDDPELAPEPSLVPAPPSESTRRVSGDAASAVQARGLRKVFGDTVAVDGLDLDIPRGSFFGLVGPNGAGKSTSLKMLTGLLRPDAGQAVVAGHDVWTDPVAVKRVIGVLPEEPLLFERLTGQQLLTYTGLLRGLDADVVAERADDLLGVLGLHDAARSIVADYSTGMRKKIALALALLHAPRVLFLDEPFESVDPVSARTLRAVLDRHRAGGGTIVFSSHVMELVERLCDRVAIVHAGRIAAVGPLDDVRGGGTLEEAFVAAVGGAISDTGSLAWLGTSSG
jgi:ABC-2 type transport system ATP-binding protein